MADDDDSNLTALQAMGADGETARAFKARHGARMAILRLDVQDKLRRVVTRGPGNSTADTVYLPGTRVYFWEPAVGRARQRRDPGR